MYWDRLFRRKRAAPDLTPDLERRIRRSFDEAAGDSEHFPETIDERILHVRVLLDWLAAAPAGRFLDAGCGKGRFAAVVQKHYPDASVHGLDLSIEMLRYVPPEVGRCAGTLTALPFADGAFDAAWATESLEHAVEIERAVAELCRVVRPGGRVLIIDKNAEQFGRLATPEWEQWFDRRALEGMLRRHCREVSSRPLSYWEDVEPDGLFFVWLAVK